MIVLLVLLLSVLGCEAATNTAATANRSDFLTAYNACANGDTLIVPAGDVRWTNTMFMNKAIIIIGSGTIIRDDLVKPVGGGLEYTAIFYWSCTNAGLHRISNLEFQPGSRPDWGDFRGIIQLAGNSKMVRLDHITFGPIRVQGLQVYSAIYGVMDHCIFNFTGNFHPIEFNQQNIGGGVFGDGSWETPVEWGSSNAFYVEDCTFSPSASAVVGVYDGFAGARSVFRNNTISNSATAFAYVSYHGTESTQRYRGGRSQEVYSNVFYVTHSSDHAIDVRSGSVVFHDNIFDGPYSSAATLRSYRNFWNFQPWMAADGTKDWDGTNRIVYDSGVASGSRSNGVIDASKAWTVNQWVGYCLRETNAFTATFGSSSNQIVVASAGWRTNQYKEWEFTKLTSNEKGRIVSNTSDTLVLDTTSYRPSFSAGTLFVLSRGCEITANTATTLTTFGPQGFGKFAYYTNGLGQAYEIRKVDFSLDEGGRGLTTALQPPPNPSRPNHQNLNQVTEPCYEWDNTYVNGSANHISSGGFGTIVAGREYFENTVKPGYTNFIYPHPLTTLDNPTNPSPPVFVSQPVGGNTSTGQVFTFTATVAGSMPITYQWKKAGVNISGETLTSYTISSTVVGDTGTYNLAATNSDGYALSSDAVLTVSPLAPATGLRVFKIDEKVVTSIKKGP